MTAAAEAVRHWTDIPKGYYALPVCDYEDESCPEIALQTYHRRVPRTFKNGRVVGGNSFGEGQTYILDKERECAIPLGTWDRDDAVGLILSNPTKAGERYGQFTGKCWSCGKRLTDPKSKHLGIGPECRGFR